MAGPLNDRPADAAAPAGVGGVDRLHSPLRTYEAVATETEIPVTENADWLKALFTTKTRLENKNHVSCV